jgi:phage gpG-like protein
MSFIDIDWFPHPTIVASQFYQLAGDINVRSLREPLKRSIQQVIAPAFKENFLSGGRPAWTPLADVTQKKKAAKGQTDDPLIATGRLMRKAQQLNVWTIDGREAEARLDNLGDVAYGYVHQNGSEHIPQREWAMLTPNEVDKVEQVFGRWLDERILVTIR